MSRTSRIRSNVAALSAAQKPSRGTAAYSRYVNRPLGRRVAAVAAAFGVTPNQATAVSATLSFSGLLLLCLADPSLGVGIAVSLLLAGGYVMDSVDGQIARLTGTGSRSGEWLDHTVDCFKTCSFHLAVLISFYRFPPVEPEWALLVPVGFQIVDMVTFFGLIMMPLLRQGTPAPSDDLTPENPLRTWAILPTDYGIFCWVFVLMGWPTLYFAGYTALFAINALVLVVVLRKWWRELKAMDR
ncbi:CDP-alcohol phosphatidyltransferase family protein [Mumia zhuanghuii]|nr:CDP-alcohol phosphatidyltransferase family protein [Mumia zhuanghuii]